ncbi:unnamed protein product, partial [marine sediment metagenome]
DYNQAISGGRADQKNIVIAPWNAQEMYDYPKHDYLLITFFPSTLSSPL